MYQVCFFFQAEDGIRDARCKDDTFNRHARLREDLRVHHDDVGHRHKCREAAQHLLFNGGMVFREFEVALDQSSTSSNRLPRMKLSGDSWNALCRRELSTEIFEQELDGGGHESMA